MVPSPTPTPGGVSTEIELLARVADQLVGGNSVEEVLRLVLDAATDLLRAGRGSILLVVPGTAEMSMRVARGVPEEVVARTRVPIGSGVAGGVAATGRPLLLTDAGRERGYKDSSAVCVPLKIKGEVLGVLNLNDRTDRPFDESDLRLATLFANQAAVALHHARLIEEVREAGRVEAALRERLGALDLVTLVTDKLVASPHLDEVLESLIQESTGLVQAERGSILLFDPREGLLRIAVARGIPPEVVENVRTRPGEGLAGKVYETGEPQFLRNMGSGAAYKSGSAMILPLRMKGQTLGVLNLANKKGGADFTDDDFVLARIVANQASIAVHNAQLAASWVENQKMKQALEIAREIQLRFLPQVAPAMEGLDVAGWSVACDDIGGDYYDYIPLGEDRVAVAIGDVSGHGIGAALLMATGRAFLRALAGHQPDLAQMLYRVNNLLAADTRDDSFMTMFLGAFDFRRRRLTYTSAGHDEPVHFRPSTGQRWELESTGIPLGMIADQEFPVAEVGDIQPGDLFAFCTDGIWEARNPRGEQFGRERFYGVIKKHIDSPPQEMIRRINEEVLTFCGPNRPHDDVSLVVVRIL